MFLSPWGLRQFEARGIGAPETQDGCKILIIGSFLKIMKTELVRRLSPEEEELAAKREELVRLEAQLADQELFLASLKAELAAFEGLYLRRVGVLYAEHHSVREKDKLWIKIHATLRAMLLCYSNEATSLELRQAGCKTFLQQLLFELIEHFDLTKLPFVDYKSQSRTSIQFGRLYNYLQGNYARHITVSQAADMSGLSSFQFMKFFRKATGTSFVTYLNRLRLSHAHQLLTETDRSIAAISAEVGFSDQSYFDRRFRQQYGKSPRQLRSDTGSF
jgi:AraC-like DNA-binding protein